MTVEKERSRNKWLAWFGGSALAIAGGIFWFGGFVKATNANNNMTPGIQKSITDVHNEVVSLRDDFRNFVAYLNKKAYGDSIRLATEKEIDKKKRREDQDKQIEMTRQTIEAVKSINK